MNDTSVLLSEAPLLDQLLRGAFDLHQHGYPEISFSCRTRVSDLDNLIASRAAGFAGIVLKSHFWPTVGRAYHLKRQVPGIEVYPSITLNQVVGGFDPLAVESAALQGARVIWFPTWGAAHDRERGGISSSILPLFLKRAATLPVKEGLRVTDERGKVKGEVLECLAVALEHQMLICTGHISPRESIALAAAANGVGIKQLVFTHPDSGSVGATREDVIEMVKLGAVYEVCAIGLMPFYQRIKIGEVVKLISELGTGNIILSSDYFHEWFPLSSEAMRMIIGTLLDCGISASDIATMVCANPRRLLRLPPASNA
jgi:hypothetical protein